MPEKKRKRTDLNPTPIPPSIRLQSQPSSAPNTRPSTSRQPRPLPPGATAARTGSGTSSSRPVQHAPRAATLPQAPAQPPPVQEAPVPPAQAAPPGNGATALSMDALLRAPARRNQPTLHPMKLNGALWFVIDDEVHTYIKKTWQNNFFGPWWNWTMVPQSRVDEWWQDFIQQYYWNPIHHDRVWFMWKKSCMESISNTISKKKRAGVKPPYITDNQWLEMLEKWETEECIASSKIHAENRLSDPDGKGSHKHCAGPVGFAKIGYNMMMESGGTTPPAFTDIVRKTHMRKDGTFIDPRAEQIVNEVEEAATQAAMEAAGPDAGTDSGESTVVASPHLSNLTYLKLVPPKKGYIYGIGSSQYQDVDPSEPRPVTLTRNIDTEMRVGALESGFQSINSSVASILEMQKLILRTLGYDPATNEQSPNATASNTTPSTLHGSVRNYETPSSDVGDGDDDVQEDGANREEEETGEE